jgi:DNA-binding Lrp family transcriptional regulator
MEILGKLLGSLAKVKIMRLFLLNQKEAFTSKDISKRSRVSMDTLRKELKLLVSIGFIKKRTKDYIFNSSFKYGMELESLLVNSDTVDSESILEIFKKTGKVKLIIVSGVFIKNKDSRVDLLIIGDKLMRSKIEEGVRRMEAEIGTELVYAIYDTKEFMYRLNMYDKLIRDILDFPHEVIFQAKELSTQSLKKV